MGRQGNSWKLAHGDGQLEMGDENISKWRRVNSHWGG